MKIKNRILSFSLTVAVVLTMFPLTSIGTSASYTDKFQFDTNGKFRVMQLTDIQDGAIVNSRSIALITNMIARYNPDLIVFTGDNVSSGLTSTLFKSSVDAFLKPIIDSKTPFAVTFGNHDDEGRFTPSKDTQYNYYKSHGGNYFVDHDVPALTGAGSGAIPIYPNDQTNIDPAFQIYLMDSGSYASSGGYDCPYTDQIDYYIERSENYPTVPSLWFMHIIVPDVYTECMTTTNNGTGVSQRGNGTPFSGNTYWLQSSRINWAKSGVGTTLAETYKEGPCPANLSTYQSQAHRSSSQHGSKTLYEAWVAHGNMLGTYYGHDHKNSFVATTKDGIDIGFGKAATLKSYNDGNPGSRIYDLDADGTYTTYNVTESDLAKAQVIFDANGGTGEMFPQFITKNSTAALRANAYTNSGLAFLGWSTSPAGSVAYADVANFTAGTDDSTLYAKWASTSAITFDANGGFGGSGPTPMDIGAALIAPPVAKTGYTLSWSPPLPATVPPIDTIYTAQWTANEYVVNYFGNGADSGTTADSSHAYDVAKNLTANGFNRIGNAFLGWSTDPRAVAAEFTNEQSVINLALQPNGVVSFYAVWSANEYLINFEANGGEGGTSSLMPYGAELIAPTVTKANYTFAGWSPEVPQTVPDQNQTYTAQWIVKQYAIVFDANGGTGGTSELMICGAPLAAPTVDREGYTFLGWLPNVPNEVPPTATVFTALWSVNSYTIGFDANGGMGGTSVSMQYGAALTPPEVTKIGYNFTGWLPTPSETVPAANTIYVAQWSAINYTITFDANGGTGGTTALLAFDLPLAPPIVEKSGFVFIEWTPAVPMHVPAADTTYTAQWGPETLTIVFDADGGTGGTSGAYRLGAPLSAPVVAKTGYTFTGWSPAVPSTVPSINTTYTAQWSVNSYRITFEAAGGSGGTSSMLTFGSSFTPPVVSRVGYEFTGWSPAVPSTVPSINTTYTAQWSVNSYRITFEAAGGSGGTSSMLTFGSSFTPPVVSRVGYEFTGWSPAVSATVPAVNMTYTAQWTPSMLTITFDANGGTGGLSAQMAYGSRFNAPIVTRVGYEFAGWSPAIPTTVPASNATYTAQWTPIDAHLTPQTGSTTVINSTDSLIYGLKTGITGEEFERDFVSVTGNARLIITQTAGGFGTGTKVEVVDNETQDIIQTFIVIIFGDVNGDGNIDGADAAKVVDVGNYLAVWDPNMAVYCSIAGDLNGDGNIDAIDAGMMIDAENHLRVIDQMNGALI